MGNSYLCILLGISMEFVVREYGRTELAQAYCPDIAPESAWKKFKRWMSDYPGLVEQLMDIGYTSHSRSFTPRQVRLIVDCLGAPTD